jgi:oxygen-independent coproporphyrinogen-3 oxidase
MAGIYLHIPFCKQACNYCDFHFSTSTKLKSNFVEALLKEMSLRKEYLDGEKIHSIYFGGGTPSLLSKEELKLIFDALYNLFDIDENAEITLEANPDDLNFEKLQVLKNSPVNRLSIGIQSFREEDLLFMNRAHNAKEAYSVVTSCRAMGFDNLSIDLIYGTPGLSDEAWKENLQIAFDLGVSHISSYALTVEEKTALYQQIKTGLTSPVDEVQSADQFKILMSEMLKNGYEQYEISNFCLPGHYSRHNSSYWKKDKYLGLGPSAHSFHGDSRLWNVANNAIYIKSINAGELPFEEEVLSAIDAYNEYVMTSLRTVWGCDTKQIKKDFSEELASYFVEEAKTYLLKGYLEETSGVYYLSQSGKLLADRIASDLFKV